jgi:hypothetical protein
VKNAGTVETVPAFSFLAERGYGAFSDSGIPTAPG